jgi:hypothetical protein
VRVLTAVATGLMVLASLIFVLIPARMQRATFRLVMKAGVVTLAVGRFTDEEKSL